MIRRVCVEDDKLILTGDSTQYVFAQGKWTVVANPEASLFQHNIGSGAPVGVPFITFWVPLYMVQEQVVPLPAAGTPSRRFLVWNDRIGANSPSAPSRSPGIYEIVGDTHKFFELPQPPYNLFARYRPKRVEDGYTEDVAQLRTDIGPFQLEGKRIWFGLRFYDGEGHTGVGGIGYFDAETRNYHLTYLKELADWSASAIYVERDTIWLGLASYGEGAGIAGGLARYDRRSRKVVRYSIPAHVNVIRRFGNGLYLGTSEGISIILDSKVDQLRFEVDLDGKYHIRR